LIKTDSDSYTIKLTKLDEEIRDLTEERNQLKEELGDKDKYYEAFIDELNEKFKKRQDADREEIEKLKTKLNENASSRGQEEKFLKMPLLGSIDTSNHNSLKMENIELNKQIDELKMAYDELKDEKTQLYLSFMELKSKQSAFQEAETFSNTFTQSKEIVKLNSLLKVGFLILFSHFYFNY
jgi:hypothetical protein